MAILLLIIFLFTDVMIVGVCWFVYSGKEEYREGMVLGVHIPQEMVDDTEVQGITQTYKRRMKKFQRWNMLLGILVCGLAFAGTGIFLLTWTLWLAAYIAGIYLLLYRPHRKMYDLKVRRGWIQESTRQTVCIDTNVSACSKKLPFSKWNYLPVLILTVVPALFLFTQKNIENLMEYWIFTGITIGVNLFFFVMHLWIEHRENTVYSENSEVNLGINRLTKRLFSAAFLIGAWCNTAAWCYAVIFLIRYQLLSTVDFVVYIGIQTLGGVGVVACFIWLQKKREKFLKTDTEQIVTDDDEYWKNGWYNNPNDSRTWVPNRLCSTNYAMNMAKTSSKVFTIIMSIFLIVFILFVAILFLKTEFTEITVEMKADSMEIRGPLYQYEVDTEDILSVELLEKLPEDNYYRTNGGDTDKLLVGHFKGKDTGKCMMFVYKEATPVLKMELEDTTVFLNSENKKETEEWYEYARDSIAD